MVRIRKVHTHHHHWINTFWWNNFIPFNNFYNPNSFNYPRNYGAWPYGYGFPNPYAYMQNFYNQWSNPFNRFNNFARFNYPFYSNFYPRNLFGFNNNFSPVDQLANVMGGITTYNQYYTGPNQIDLLANIMDGINIQMPQSAGYSYIEPLMNIMDGMNINIPVSFGNSYIEPLMNIMDGPGLAARQIFITTQTSQANSEPINYLGSA